MGQSSHPSTRELIQELATIEDRMHAVRAATARTGTSTHVTPELVQLARREEQVLALLRLQRSHG
jgi:hypothetical protein